jgi:hypothetical protein
VRKWCPREAGLTLGKLKARFIGKSQAKSKEQLRDALKAPTDDGEIWGPAGISYLFITGAS